MDGQLLQGDKGSLLLGAQGRHCTDWGDPCRLHRRTWRFSRQTRWWRTFQAGGMECTKVKSFEVWHVGKKVFSYDCTPECTWGVVGEEARGRARMMMTMVNILSTYCMSDIVPSVLHILCLNLYSNPLKKILLLSYSWKKWCTEKLGNLPESHNSWRLWTFAYGDLRAFSRAVSWSVPVTFCYITNHPKLTS